MSLAGTPRNLPELGDRQVPLRPGAVQVRLDLDWWDPAAELITRHGQALEDSDPLPTFAVHDAMRSARLQPPDRGARL